MLTRREESHSNANRKDSDGIDASKNTKIGEIPAKENNIERLISYEAEDLIKKYSEIENSILSETGQQKIKVGSTLSSLAFFYERVRNSIDYKQDHVQLRSSIERIIKRLLWENPSHAINTKRLSCALVKELIWARYLNNSEIPERKTYLIAQILERSLYFLSTVTNSNKKIITTSIRDYILGITSGEIEEILKPNLIKSDYLTESIYLWFIKRFEWNNFHENEITKKVHLWAAIYRSSFKADLSSLRYHLLKRFYPKWVSLNKDNVKGVKDEFITVATNLEKIISSEKHLRVLRIIQKITPAFIIFSEIIESEEQDIVTDRKALSLKIEKYGERKYEEIGSRLRTGIVRSVVYIFATKIIFALLLEVPYEILLLKNIRYIPVLINLIFPPLLMVFVGLLIKRPGRENTKRIEEWIYDFVYNDKKEKIDFVVGEKTNKGLAYKIFSYLYLLFFVTLFSTVAYFLYNLNFSVLSAFIFFSFVSLVLLFGYKVKNTASEFNVISDDEGIIGNMVSIVFLPFLNLGSWLSSKISRLNILMLLLDFLIEAPLKNILAILQDWTTFIKEKKEEFIDVPNN